MLECFQLLQPLIRDSGALEGHGNHGVPCRLFVTSDRTAELRDRLDSLLTGGFVFSVVGMDGGDDPAEGQTQGDR